MSYPPGNPPPPPSGPPAPGYGGPGGPAPSDKDNQVGVWALVTGILGFCCGPIGIAAIILGRKSQSAAAQGTATNGGLGTAGFILGCVAVVLWVINLVLLVTGTVDYGF